MSYKSWKIKQIIYITMGLIYFYDANTVDKLTLSLGVLLSGISFYDFSQKKKWTIYNSWSWHIGNSIFIYISEKSKLRIM